MKKIIMTIIILSAIVILSGCAQNTKISDDVTSTPAVSDGNNIIRSIFNSQNEKLGQINNSCIMQTDDSLIYFTQKGNLEATDYEIEYYRYLLESKNSIKLGSVKQQQAISYDKVLINNHIYFFISTGDISSLKTTLYDIDLNTNIMSESNYSPNYSVYNSMTVVENKIIMVNGTTDGCIVEEYNPLTKSSKEIKKYAFDNSNNTGETVRQITSDKNTVSLLVLKMETEENVTLRIDTYDLNFNFLKSTDLSSISDDSNELRQPVFAFKFTNDIIYYENRSITRFLGKSTNGTLTPLTDTPDDLFESAEELTPDDNSIFCKIYGNGNYIYRLNHNTGKLEKTEFYADDERYYITHITKTENGKIAISMSYKDDDTGMELPERLYLMDEGELF